jgi:hypothetical protein
MRVSDLNGIDLMVNLSNHELVEPWAAWLFSILPEPAL